MADNRITAPAMGTLGTTPAIQSTTPSAHAMPRWAYLALALACAGMGLWSSVVTLQFFEHGATALETDAALQSLAKGAALLFVFGEMSSFTLAALLTGRAFQARRWMLYGFAGAVLAIEVFTISSVQMAMVRGADLTQTSVSSDLTDLQKQIDAAEKSAASFSATAEALRADKQVSKAMKADGLAAAERDKTSQLYDRLETARKSKRPTLTGLMGEKTALSYAIARGILVSLAGLVFFGTAGALLRSARGGALSVDQQILELLQRIHGAPAAPAQAAEIVALAPAQTVAPAPALAAPVAPAPAPASFKTAEPIEPKDYSTGLSYSSKIKLAGAGLLAGAGALTAPITHTAPAADASAGALKQSHLSAAKQSHSAEVEQAQTGAAGASAGASAQSHSGATEQSHFSESQQQQTGASGASENPGQSETEQAHPASPSAGKTGASKRAWTTTAVPDGDKLDSAVSGKGATRYNRVKTAVKSGKLKPSMRAIQLAEGGGGIVVRRYLQQLETEGVIVRAGRGYALATKIGGAA